MGLAEALQARGIDAVHVYEAGQGGGSDEARLAFATAERRCLVTYNKRDFIILARTRADVRTPDAGIAAAVRCPAGDVLRALVAVTEATSNEDLRDRLLHV